MTVRPGSAVPGPPPLPDVFFARDYPRSEVAARVRDGTWEPVSRGAYAAADSVHDPRDRALARIVAVHRRTGTAHWFSHESAAVLWGLPVWRHPPTTHLRQLVAPGRQGRDPSVERHRGAVPHEHRTTVGGLPVTSLALTALDCARSLPPLDALVVADGALRAGAGDDEVAALLAVRGRRARAAEQVLAQADPGAESAPETAVRYHLVAGGLPVPQTQVPVATHRGTYWVDLGYPHLRVAVEYDGRQKYDRDGWFREKQRLDAIVEAGWRVVRVTAEDLHNSFRLVARVRQVLAAA